MIVGGQGIDHVVDTDNQQMKMMKMMKMMGRMGRMGVLMSWTKEDPEVAFSWYEENRDKLGGGGMYGGFQDAMMFRSLAKHDLSRALSGISELDSRNKKQQALSGIAQGVVNEPEKLETLIAFLDAEDDPKIKSAVMASVIRNMAMQDPESAQTYLQTIEDEEEKKKQTDNLIQSWSYQDPEAAITWGVEQAPDVEAELKIVESYVDNWARQDAKAAGAWANSTHSWQGHIAITAVPEPSSTALLGPSRPRWTRSDSPSSQVIRPREINQPSFQPHFHHRGAGFFRLEC